MISLSMDLVPFYFKMKKASLVTGLSMYEIGNNVMAHLSIDAMKRTPPLGLDNKGLKIGERRIYKDVSIVIKAVPDDQVSQFGSNWTAYNDGQPIGHMFKRKDGTVYGVDYDKLGLSEGVLAAAHQGARLASTGRVSKAGTYTKNIGRWKFVNRVHAPAALRRSYIKKIQGHVGKTKSGWLAAVSHFCRIGRVAFPSGVDWVQRHGAMHGSFVDGMDRAKGNGYLVAINSIPWIQRFAGLVNWAVKTRINDFNKGYFELRMNKKFAEAGLQ